MAPVVSVLLPVRNAEPTLALALGSLLHQTFHDFEVLVLDDGSTDKSVEIASRMADPRVRVVSDGEHKGLSARLNQGIGLARGRYIARMDADDICFPERIARQVGFLEGNPAVDLVGARAIVFRDDGSQVGMLPWRGEHSDLVSAPWRNIPLPHPTWMGRAEWFRRHRYRIPEVRRAEDQELLLRASETSRFACLPEVLLGYRQGRFTLGRTLLARRSLLAAQLRYFAKRRRWLGALKAVALTTLKVTLDLLASLPGAGRIFFLRMAETPPRAASATLERLLR